MKRYKNISGESGVTAYEILEEGIRVQFISKDIYYYSYDSTGKKHIEKMKTLAKKGRGLATYISQNIREKFELKEERKDEE